MNIIPAIHKPVIQAVPLATGLRWRGGGDYHFAEKMDGEFALRSGPLASLVAGEAMPDGTFYAFNVARFAGQEVTGQPFRARLAMLDEIFATLPRADGAPWRRPATGNGGEFLETVLARGGEGVVASHWEAPWGVMQFKCKRAETFLCVVTGRDHARGSVELADRATGQPRGRLALRGKFDRVRAGSVLKVVAFGAHPSGLLREARLDADTPTSWLVIF